MKYFYVKYYLFLVLKIGIAVSPKLAQLSYS